MKYKKINLSTAGILLITVVALFAAFAIATGLGLHVAHPFTAAVFGACALLMLAGFVWVVWRGEGASQPWHAGVRLTLATLFTAFALWNGYFHPVLNLILTAVCTAGVPVLAVYCAYEHLGKLFSTHFFWYLIGFLFAVGFVGQYALSDMTVAAFAFPPVFPAVPLFALLLIVCGVLLFMSSRRKDGLDVTTGVLFLAFVILSLVIVFFGGHFSVLWHVLTLCADALLGACALLTAFERTRKNPCVYVVTAALCLTALLVLLGASGVLPLAIPKAFFTVMYGILVLFSLLWMFLVLKESEASYIGYSLIFSAAFLLLAGCLLFGGHFPPLLGTLVPVVGIAAVIAFCIWLFEWYKTPLSWDTAVLVLGALVIIGGLLSGAFEIKWAMVGMIVFYALSEVCCLLSIVLCALAHRRDAERRCFVCSIVSAIGASVNMGAILFGGCFSAFWSVFTLCVTIVIGVCALLVSFKCTREEVIAWILAPTLAMAPFILGSVGVMIGVCVAHPFTMAIYSVFSLLVLAAFVWTVLHEEGKALLWRAGISLPFAMLFAVFALWGGHFHPLLHLFLVALGALVTLFIAVACAWEGMERVRNTYWFWILMSVVFCSIVSCQYIFGDIHFPVFAAPAPFFLIAHLVLALPVLTVAAIKLSQDDYGIASTVLLCVFVAISLATVLFGGHFPLLCSVLFLCIAVAIGAFSILAAFDRTREKPYAYAVVAMLSLLMFLPMLGFFAILPFALPKVFFAVIYGALASISLVWIFLELLMRMPLEAAERSSLKSWASFAFCGIFPLLVGCLLFGGHFLPIWGTLIPALALTAATALFFIVFGWYEKFLAWNIAIPVWAALILNACLLNGLFEFQPFVFTVEDVSTPWLGQAEILMPPMSVILNISCAVLEIFLTVYVEVWERFNESSNRGDCAKLIGRSLPAIATVMHCFFALFGWCSQWVSAPFVCTLLVFCAQLIPYLFGNARRGRNGLMVSSAFWSVLVLACGAVALFVLDCCGIHARCESFVWTLWSLIGMTIPFFVSVIGAVRLRICCDDDLTLDGVAIMNLISTVVLVLHIGWTLFSGYIDSSSSWALMLLAEPFVSMGLTFALGCKVMDD